MNPEPIPDADADGATGVLPTEEEGRKEGGELAVPPTGSPSLSPASSDHRPQPPVAAPKKRGRPPKSAASSAPPAKRAAVHAETTNADASGSRLEDPPAASAGRRPTRAAKARTYYEEPTSEEEESDDEGEDELDPDFEAARARNPTDPNDPLPYGGDGSYTPVKPANPTGRKRGRPPGAKNKHPRPLQEGEVRKPPRVKREPSLDSNGEPKPKKERKPGSGRPKGSKNKATLLKEAEERKRLEEENGGPLSVDRVDALEAAPEPANPDLSALKPEDDGGPAALHLAHEALLRALPAHALNLEHHQYELAGEGGVAFDGLEPYQQAEAIQVALQQQILHRQQQEEQAGDLEQ